LNSALGALSLSSYFLFKNIQIRLDDFVDVIEYPHHCPQIPKRAFHGIKNMLQRVAV